MAVTLTRKLIETALAAGPGNRPYVMLWDNSPKGLGLRSGQDRHVRGVAAKRLVFFEHSGKGKLRQLQTLRDNNRNVSIVAASRW